jgi:UDP-N-acetylglucosamine--N-acetylmuramyl-(pentapeptide) pyrophosphoryl-undecaprenol N-acetylglucosamine transferase
VKKKIFICGGHVTPALALIDELSVDHTLEIVYIGRTYAVEYGLITQRGIRFLPLTAGKRSWNTLTKIPAGFIRAFNYCKKEAPNVVVSFGGYVALPVCVAAWLLGIPVITHEQTLSPGLANKIIAHIARRICVAFEETSRQFPKNKTVFTGLPMRKELFLSDVQPQKRSLIYITGGSQGAISLNEKIYPAIGILTRDYTIVHQTGPKTYPSSENYSAKKFIATEELSRILNTATMVIGRSGANTTLELAALGVVAILVPLPWSAGNEQYILARWLAIHGGAYVLEQEELSVETLLTCVKKVRKNFSNLKNRANSLSVSIPRDGALRFAMEVRKFL